MTSRERILTALNCKQPDMVPWFNESTDMELVAGVLGFDLPPEMRGQVLEYHDVDTPLPGGFTMLDFFQTLQMDAMAVPSPEPPLFVETQRNASGKEIIKSHKIKTRDDLKLVKFPKIDEEYLYPIHKFVKKYRDTNLALSLRTRMGPSGVLNSMGLENFAYALVDDPELPGMLLDMYIEWCIELLHKTEDIGIDFIRFSDDIAFKSGPMFSPDIFREIFMPGMKKAANEIKLPWIYHSDGNLMPIIDDLLSLGMNGLHPLEPGAMDIEQFKLDYGDRVCICGNIDLHYTLTMGTPEEVKQEVKERIEKIGKGGGYILGTSNTLVKYIKPENLIAMRDTFLKYRKY